jgi:hypothetical protein
MGKQNHNPLAIAVLERSKGILCLIEMGFVIVYLEHLEIVGQMPEEHYPVRDVQPQLIILILTVAIGRQMMKITGQIVIYAQHGID